MLIALDLLLVAIATLLAFALRNNLDLGQDEFAQFLLYLSVTLTAGVVVLWVKGAHRVIWRFTALNDYLNLASASAMIVACAVVVAFFFNRLAGVPRSMPLIQLSLMVVLLVGARVLYQGHRWRRNYQKSSKPTAPIQAESCVLIVGLNPMTELFINYARTCASKRIVIAGIVSERRCAAQGRIAFGQAVLGEVSDLPSVLSTLEIHGVNVNRVVVTVSAEKMRAEQLSVISDMQRRRHVVVDYFSDRFDFAGLDRIPASFQASFQDLHIAGNREASSFPSSLSAVVASSKRPYWKLKRAIDATMAIALIALLAIPLALIGLLTRVSLGAPCLFWQYRPGLDGRRFKLYKFRSMHARQDPPQANAPDDPQSSRVGLFLRRTRLDEWPQLVNVLRGEMSFIGPRPLLLSEQIECPSARLSVRPGLTGWAQVNGGRQLSIEDKLALDLWYIKNASFQLDLFIGYRTFEMLMLGERSNAQAISSAKFEFGLTANRSVSVEADSADHSLVCTDQSAPQQMDFARLAPS